MKRPLLLLIPPLLLAAASCGDDDDTGALTDLPDSELSTQIGHTDVIVNADRFPNFAHTCWTGEGAVVGFWSTTDRVTIIVYNDWLCPGSTKEQPMTVLTGSPRDIINATSG